MRGVKPSGRLRAISQWVARLFSCRHEWNLALHPRSPDWVVWRCARCAQIMALDPESPPSPPEHDVTWWRAK